MILDGLGGFWVWIDGTTRLMLKRKSRHPLTAMRKDVFVERRFHIVTYWIHDLTLSKKTQISSMAFLIRQTVYI